MKLLYITNQVCGSAGLERVLSIKASYLTDKLGYEVHILTLNQGSSPLFYSYSSNIKFHDISLHGNVFKYPYLYSNGIIKKIKLIKPDIISVCDDGLKAFFLPFILGKPCPMIYERHVSKNVELKTDNVNFFNKIITKIKFSLMHLGAKKYDKFIVLTNDNLKEWKLDNLEVISNPLSFNPTNLSNLENKKVLVVGRHSFQKGYDRLLQIWKNVSEKHPNWQLDIYGKFDENETFLKLSEKLDLSKTINFFPPVKNIEAKYKEASIYLMTSRFEGFGMVLIEAMAFGVPCISFDCPCGPNDIISNGENGFLIENDNLESFSNHLELLIKDSDLRKKMGSKAKLKTEKYLPETIVNQWDSLFNTLKNP
ncbi:glycosyltransferase family 4 protein [Mariniflexile soesokkakense]|uniref:Glycosyltransferase family 4 protein n=1 Tax=Mariniflexile soesokkakense TaxID=1343160 RepID=A0ABV0ADV5_9FLAO